MIASRVYLDSYIGPFDCQLDHGNGPYFPLDSARQVSAATIRMAEEYGYTSVDTIHVIDGREDSAETVHVIEGGTSRYRDEEGESEDLAVAVRINWRGLDRDPQQATRITDATPKARKAARKNKATGRGAARAVVIHISWMYLDEGSDTAVNVVRPTREGLFPIGDRHWPWDPALWTCLCGYEQYWHETDCLCGLTRDGQPSTPLEVATWKAGNALRRRAPESTSALIDIHDGRAHVIAVFAGDTELDTADDGGIFDTETLGEADTLLQEGVDGAAIADRASTPGWEHTPDERSAHVYRITFPACPAN